MGPTQTPSNPPTDEPTIDPTAEPTSTPTNEPTAVPTADPTVRPTRVPTLEPGLIQRDCELFAIDEYLDQCSVTFAETVEGVTASIEGVAAAVYVIQNTELPVVAALGESNTANITDLAATISVVQDSSIPGIESDVTALNERLTLMERRVRSFETSAAKTSRGQFDQASLQYPAQTSLYAQYKGDLALALLASNLALMAYVAWSCRSRRGRGVKYAEVYMPSSSEADV